MITTPSEGTEGRRAVLIARIAAELEAALGSPARVAEACDGIRALRTREDDPARRAERALHLAACLSRRGGAVAGPLLDLLLEEARDLPAPEPLLARIFGSRESAHRRLALEEARQLLEAGRLRCGAVLLAALAAWVEEAGEEASGTDRADLLGAIETLAGGLAGARRLFLEDPEERVRRLGARLLDRRGAPAPIDLARAALGESAAAFLEPHLAFTRASHEDLHDVREAGADRLVESLREAESVCGRDLLLRIASALGWPRFAHGLEVRPRLLVRVRGSFPFLLTPEEASLLSGDRAVQILGKRLLAIARGAPAGSAPPEDPGTAQIQRFRALNLLHAEALHDLLDLAPIDAGRARRILDRMDAIVGGYGELFAGLDPEAPALRTRYAELRDGIDPDHLDAGAVRRIQRFEDPSSLAAVRTLHGLKRLLHQKGLRLGFQLMGSGRTTNRTVDLLVASEEEVLRVARVLRYIDFEDDEPGAGEAPLPPAVALAVEAFLPVLVHDAGRLPEARLFCYGNEVHAYLSFGSHPAWLRIDLAPPLRGGMIDLEYYGVSKVEVEAHPAIELQAIRHLLRRRDFDVEVRATRVHARYDKERALDIGDLRAAAAGLFRLAPYLMEIDWRIGSLRYDETARARVAAAWSDFHASWGVLPIERWLTRDGRRILLAVEPALPGEKEIAWDGGAPYRDVTTTEEPSRIVAILEEALRARGIAPPPGWEGPPRGEIGQIDLETRWLAALRAARAAGAVRVENGELRAASPEEFAWRHEAELFAEILQGGEGAIAEAASIGRLVSPLERILRFERSGAVNGCEVARARVPLWGETLTFHVLRDAEGMIRLGFFTHGPAPSVRRPVCPADASPEPPADAAPATTARAIVDASRDAPDLAARLRRAGLLQENARTQARPADAVALARIFFGARPHRAARKDAGGSRVLRGMVASPGRATGRVLFSLQAGRGAARDASELAGSIWIAPSLRPEETGALLQTAGIVATGGGILSHVGLVASELGKPALILPAEWVEERNGSMALRGRRREAEEETARIGGLSVTILRKIRTIEEIVREGDWVVLDAEEGGLVLLANHPDVGAFFEGLRQLHAVESELSRGPEEGGAADGDEEEILVLRGRRIRWIHKLERLASSLTDGDTVRAMVHALLFPEGEGVGHGERAFQSILSALLSNRSAAEAAREALADERERLARRGEEALMRARSRIPESGLVHEVLALGEEVRRWNEEGARIERAIGPREGVGGGRRTDGGPPREPLDAAREIDALARKRLQELRSAIEETLAREPAPPEPFPPLRERMRYLLRGRERIAEVLGETKIPRAVAARAQALAESDRIARERARGRRVLAADPCGAELIETIGGKAANLGELARLLGGSPTPPWFAITDMALQEAMAPVRSAVQEALASRDADEEGKSLEIRRLFEEMVLPKGLAAEILEAAGAVVPDGSPVSVRSSGCEEDTESHAAAGEFETFLFVQGEEALLSAVRRAWAGFWTERAIRRRAQRGLESLEVHGGLVVQKMARVRVSGVLMTAHLAAGRMDEMVVNVGLGLGEGIVSGSVEADQVVVAKAEREEEGGLRFRYRTGEKREKVVARRDGRGTVRVETLAHERLRPALEYRELEEIVGVAGRLESLMGLPLDLEFGYEDEKLWILQARPIPRCAAILGEAIARARARREDHP